MLSAAGVSLRDVLAAGFQLLENAIRRDPELRQAYLGIIQRTTEEDELRRHGSRAAALMNLSANVGCHCMGSEHEPGCPYLAR